MPYRFKKKYGFQKNTSSTQCPTIQAPGAVQIPARSSQEQPRAMQIAARSSQEQPGAARGSQGLARKASQGSQPGRESSQDEARRSPEQSRDSQDQPGTTGPARERGWGIFKRRLAMVACVAKWHGTSTGSWFMDMSFEAEFHGRPQGLHGSSVFDF